MCPFLCIFDIVPETWGEAIFNAVHSYERAFYIDFI